MPEFSYKVKGKSGEVVEGMVNAPDEDIAVNILHSRGYIVLSLEPANSGLFTADLNQYFSFVSTRDIVIFTRQLSTLIDADMPLNEGLRTLANQVEKPKFQEVINSIANDVEGGSTLSSALAEFPKLFSIFYVKLVQSGEASGKMHDALLYLADYLEKNQAIISKIRGALSYPAFILFALVVVTIIMAVFVLPQLLSIFEELGVEDLPLTTKVIIWTVNFINKFIIPIIVFFAGLIAYLIYYIRTPSGKYWFDSIVIGAPSFGVIARNIYLSRISDSLSTLIKSGIPIIDSLRITSDLVNNKIYQQIMLEAADNIKGGGSISETFAKFKEMPPLFTSMVAIGERTGKLDFILEHISKYYKSEAENSINNISQIIEPVLVLILGFAVFVLVSAILLPIYNLVGI